MTHTRLLAPTLAIGLLLALHARADDTVLQYRSGDTVDPQQVARVLGQRAMAEDDGAPRLTRSIRLLDSGSAAAPVAAAAVTATAGTRPAPVDDLPAALSLPVQFAFDSADILPAARTQLDALAAGIKLLPADHPVVIEGHTDAVGSQAYNAALSARRAHAVRHYLATRHGIAAQRLHAVGLGKAAPLNAQDPYAAENRRVQFRGG